MSHFIDASARHLAMGFLAPDAQDMNQSPSLIQLLDCQCDGLAVPDWRINAGAAWCVFGLNGSGKQLIDQLLVGEITPLTGSIQRSVDSEEIALISFERQQATYEEEWRLAATDIIPED